SDLPAGRQGSRAKVIVGGGDTVALVSKMRLEKKFHFVSTGGGAMLDFLADGKLPGIDALVKNKNN
ncbi:MAG: phosphoglycerate kinase, partial [Candidatus Pacebacteria bacterium]|nr:phosphoglycerate kinase [Candidatus Paceibacterota bacterium]